MNVSAVSTALNRVSVDTSTRKVEETAPDESTKNHAQRFTAETANGLERKEISDQQSSSQKSIVDSETNANEEQVDDKSESANAKSENNSDTTQLSVEDLKIVDDLKRRDSEVRAHEAAHVSAAGGLASGSASFAYQEGPDGMKYAVSGEVQVDTSRGRSPEETLVKAQRIRAAALAPRDPSAQDQAVASQANEMATGARTDIVQEANDAQLKQDIEKAQSNKDESETQAFAVDENQKSSEKASASEERRIELSRRQQESVDAYEIVSKSNPKSGRLLSIEV